VISLIRRGKATKDIVQATGVSRAQVIRMKNRDNPNRERPHGGRPGVIPKFTKQVILFKVRRGYLLLAKDVQKYLWSLGHMISYSSTTHLLRSLGLKSLFKKRKPLVRDIHRKRRLQWARKHRHWTVEDWKKVIFSDETKINRWGSDGAQITWKHKDDPIQPHNIQTQLKGGGGSMMVWGCMTSLGVGYACRIIEYPMKSELYTHILDTSYKDTLSWYGLNKRDVIFQQDGDTKHTSKFTINWFEKNKINYMKDWPANSPDLNPIENLWNQVKKKLDAYETKPRNINELWERFDVEWNKFAPEDIIKYYEGMPKRIEEVIKNKGRPTKH
jgi:transposase